MIGSDIITFGANLVQTAGQRLLVDFGRIDSEPKGDFDLVTRADLEIEAFIKTEIQNCYPTHQIIAEESCLPGTSEPLNEFCWVVDPLDGTVNFALGAPFFCVSVALLYKGYPLLGWVYDPVRQELFHARQGKGSFVNNKSLFVEANPQLPLLIGGSSGFLKWSLESGSAVPLLSLLEQFGKVRILGSQALHLCYVAAGRLQGAISWEGRLWDDAAGALIAQEAGANYTNFWGQAVFPLSSGSPLLHGEPIHSVAAAPAVHKNILSKLT